MGLSSPCILAEEKVVTSCVARVAQHVATRATSKNLGVKDWMHPRISLGWVGWVRSPV